MTPRIAFALAFSVACGASSADEATGQGSASLRQPAVDGNAMPGLGSASPALIGTDAVMRVVELSAPAAIAETIDLTAEPEELYQRMRLGFSMPNLNSPLVLHHQQWYLNHPESLRRMVERSSRYLHHIIEEIEKRGMPTELALLPMVESAYNPTAYSRSHASGLWQFIPATGKQYKLEQNWWVDSRRDIVASTAAALEYLQYIYDLHGDWHLALASYNWGEGAVGRAIGKNAAQGLPTDYLNLKMPEETRHYVPKLLALKNIFSNPHVLASLNLRGVPNRPYFATVTKTANIDVKLAAELAGMSVKDFVALNPAHNRPVIKSETPMVIPADKVDAFISNLEAHEESEKPLCSWQPYTLRAGETLEHVAPRFGMTVANLRAVNGINGRIKVTAGQTLLVAAQEGADAGEVATGTELSATAEPTRVALPPRLPLIEPTPVASTRSHIVQKGETLPKLAQRYGLTLAELKKLNSLYSDRAVPGMKLAVAATEPASKAAASTGQRTTLAEAEHRADTRAVPVPTRSDVSVATNRQHTVAKGETLFSVAQRYHLSVSELKQINGLRAEQVNAGTRLTVAVADARQSVAKAESKTETARPTGKKPAKLAQYTIRRGDTLVSIAKQFKVEKDDLLRWNRIQAGDIKAGQTLTIQLVQNTY